MGLCFPIASYLCLTRGFGSPHAKPTHARYEGDGLLPSHTKKKTHLPLREQEASQPARRGDGGKRTAGGRKSMTHTIVFFFLATAF